jgi:hypothetical protein
MPAQDILRTLAAPYDLVRLCSRAETRRTIRDGTEMLARQWCGGLTVVTPPGGAGQGDALDAPAALRSLIQLDGEVLLMVDRSWLEGLKAPGELERALASHAAAIAAALQPLQQGVLMATRIVRLGEQSRWSVFGLGALFQGGAIGLAPSLATASSFQSWLWAAAGQLEVVLLQSLSLVLLVVVSAERLALRWWIRRRLAKRLPALMDQMTQQEVAVAPDR